MEFYNKSVKDVKGLEMIFFSLDKTEKDQTGFLQSAKCPFPTLELKSSAVDGPVKILGQHHNDSVPQFVLVDASGKKLYDGEEPPNPEKLKELMAAK